MASILYTVGDHTFTVDLDPAEVTERLDATHPHDFVPLPRVRHVTAATGDVLVRPARVVAITEFNPSV